MNCECGDIFCIRGRKCGRFAAAMTPPCICGGAQRIAELEQQVKDLSNKNSIAFDVGRDAALELIAGLFQDSMHTHWTQDECVKAITEMRTDIAAEKAAVEAAIEKGMLTNEPI